jgi:hypothetical protein
VVVPGRADSPLVPGGTSAAPRIAAPREAWTATHVSRWAAVSPRVSGSASISAETRSRSAPQRPTKAVHSARVRGALLVAYPIGAAQYWSAEVTNPMRPIGNVPTVS